MDIPSVDDVLTTTRAVRRRMDLTRAVPHEVVLALRSRGLGSVWTTLHLAKEREVADLLGIPDSVTQIAMFPVAYTVGTDFRPASRPPIETITSWNTWGGS